MAGVQTVELCSGRKQDMAFWEAQGANSSRPVLGRVPACSLRWRVRDSSARARGAGDTRRAWADGPLESYE